MVPRRPEHQTSEESVVNSTASTTTSTTSTTSTANNPKKSKKEEEERPLPPHRLRKRIAPATSRTSGAARAPLGLLNVGNTCYANAALQCLLCTALAHALLDPKTTIIFKRYASNPGILAKGSGSVDEDEVNPDDDDDAYQSDDADLHPQPQTNDTASTGGGDDIEKARMGDSAPIPSLRRDAAEKTRLREERRRRREQRRKEKEKRICRETCNWLKGELTHITREFIAGPEHHQQLPPPPSTASYIVGSLFGFANQSSTPKPKVVDPGSITRRVNRLSTCLHPYQQEDAHEFLRALLSTLIMDGQNRQLSSLFDGLLESAVTCQKCRRASLTRDRYMDLSLDITDPSVVDLPSALQHFTKVESLDGDNKVMCDRCQIKRPVQKGLRLATAPTILVCHFKRFACDPYGRAIRLPKHIPYPTRLEIGDFMSKANRGRPPPYGLVAVLVHSGGRSCDSGHYLSYVKHGKLWYCANDSKVTQVTEQMALDQRAYILIYEVEGMRERHGFNSFSRYQNNQSSSTPTSNNNNNNTTTNHREVDDAESFHKNDTEKSTKARSASAPRPRRRGSIMANKYVHTTTNIPQGTSSSSSLSPSHSQHTNVHDNEHPNQDNDYPSTSPSPHLFHLFCGHNATSFSAFDICGGTEQVSDDIALPVAPTHETTTTTTMEQKDPSPPKLDRDTPKQQQQQQQQQVPDMLLSSSSQKKLKYRRTSTEVDEFHEEEEARRTLSDLGLPSDPYNHQPWDEYHSPPPNLIQPPPPPPPPPHTSSGSDAEESADSYGSNQSSSSRRRDFIRRSSSGNILHIEEEAVKAYYHYGNTRSDNGKTFPSGTSLPDTNHHHQQYENSSLYDDAKSDHIISSGGGGGGARRRLARLVSSSSSRSRNESSPLSLLRKQQQSPSSQQQQQRSPSPKERKKHIAGFPPRQMMTMRDRSLSGGSSNRSNSNLPPLASKRVTAATTGGGEK